MDVTLTYQVKKYKVTSHKMVRLTLTSALVLAGQMPITNSSGTPIYNLKKHPPKPKKETKPTSREPEKDDEKESDSKDDED